MDRIGRTATTVATVDGVLKVTYWETVVVAWDRNENTVKLNSDGYFTTTTKARMNQAAAQFGLGYSVFQKNHDWFVDLPGGETVPFEDQMEFSVA